ncbi:DEAD/DEAH box helicase [Microbacterium sp. CFBP 8790]|uniref:DEAD/DEAH box helicase n=1 Tax=unclassified Microbacterium TaxID=2609290 RepID=UPI00177FBDF5|nr:MULTISPECIES: DEAD/DEAH box helicase [unclassified Microbacterium]MBD8205179.1 DEAD/DEAH box helicase [Microbacterium sp. CFBP 8801]MBD8509766.1 DEAD/DEAH box helicase [Microbacterium sp. CFBP 8790]
MREYHQAHLEDPDVALELPTGSGKTLVGLLIAEWRRRKYQHRVVYACPTKQLALQVAEAAERQGIKAHALIDSHRNWEARELSAYTRAQALAVTTYSHVFNSHSQFAGAKTLLFDDAHAAEGYVAEAWSLEVGNGSSVYNDLFDAIGDAVDPHLAARMTGDGPDTVTTSEVRLLPQGAVSARIPEILAVLDAGLTNGSDAWWRFRMIREHLASCLFYVARSGWYIRPMIPPTFEHVPFTGPGQRIYLSATLGEAGELERAFGRGAISRIASPEAWERTGSGRRFFVFPDLAEFDSAEDATVVPPPASSDELDGVDVVEEPSALQRIAALAEKHLILTQALSAAKQIAKLIGTPKSELIVASDTTVQTFKDAERGTLLAPNRYDGMDLADKSCRFMVLADVPAASHLQDKFLSGKLRAGEVLAERIRTRIVQGAGRCTRGPQDWAVVAIHGQELLRYLSDPDNVTSMPVELQAEIEFGLAASATNFSNLVALTRSALAQDEDWRTYGERAIADNRAHAERIPQPLSAHLAASAVREVSAWQKAWQGEWEAAGRAAVAVLEGLSDSGARSYRALWAYLASAWFGLSADAGNALARARAAELLKTAHGAATGAVWLREIQPLPPEDVVAEPWDEDAIQRVLALISGPLRSSSAFSSRSQAMLHQLAQTEASQYELGLVELGRFLGADSFKPSGKGKTDAAWIWDELWMTVEAKSEQTTDKLSMEYVRKANTQLDSLAADKDADEFPPGSVGVIVAPSQLVEPTAVPIAAPHLYLCTPDELLDVAHAVHRALVAIRAGVNVNDSGAGAAIQQHLWDHRVLPTQVKERLTGYPIRGTR